MQSGQDDRVHPGGPVDSAAGARWQVLDVGDPLHSSGRRRQRREQFGSLGHLESLAPSHWSNEESERGTSEDPSATV
jgi:hypothetical protein